MERKIENFAEVKFKFELPEILVLPSCLDIAVRTDSEAVGSFKIRFKNDVKYDRHKIRGYITCNDYRLKFDLLTFSSKEVEINYKFDGMGLRPEQDYNGSIHLITDCGEFTLPYHVAALAEELSTGEDEVKNIYQFAAFAKSNTERAVELFYEDRFESIILSAL